MRRAPEIWTIREASSDADVVRVGLLFEEYSRALGISLEFQGFDLELATLPGDYARPHGCLFLAEIHDKPVGCVGVRRLGADSCEMKRLFVKDPARRRGLGSALAQAAIAFAGDAGYRVMRLDTLPTMTPALALYRRLGFQDTVPYRFNPVADAVFMELVLAAHHGTADIP